MACCWNPKKRKFSECKGKPAEHPSCQLKEKQEERQSSQPKGKWEQQQFSQSKDRKFLIDCMRTGKEDEALHMIAAMGARSLCQYEYVEGSGYFQGTPFYHAMKLRRPRIVSALLKKGVIWDVQTYTHEYKDLFECIENNKQDESLDLVKGLVVPNIEQCKSYYNDVFGTSLINAVQHGMMKVVTALLEKVVDPYKRETSETEVLGACLKRNMQDEVLEMVASMNVTALNHTPSNRYGVYVETLMNAVQFGRNKVVRALLEKRVEWNEPLSLEIKAVFECIESDKQDEALDLIASLDVTALNLIAYYGQGVYVTAIMYALQQGRLRVVRALLVKGAEWDKYHTFETTALFECLERTMHSETLDLIASMEVENLNLIADYDFGNNLTALMYAVLLDEMRIVKALLEKGVDVNVGQVVNDVYGYSEETPLYYAIRNDKIALMNMLLEHGADPLFNRANKQRYIGCRKEMWNVSLKVSFNLAMIRGIFTLDRIIPFINMYTEINKHLCLCFALQYGFHARVKLQIIHIIQSGGVVCLGNPDNTAMEVGYPCAKGICSNVFNTLKGALNIWIDNRRQVHAWDSDARLFLTLICATDYVHENSCLYKTIEAYMDSVKSQIIPVDLDALNRRRCKQQHKLEERQQVLAWMADITKHPSTLKHICRVYIRRSIPKLCTEAVETLPLPRKLIEYVNVVDRLFVRKQQTPRY